LPTFANTSRSFSGWNTSRDGSGTSYADGSQFSFKEDLVLYAQWTLAVTDTFSFNANGGDGTVASITGSPGSTFTVPGQAGLIRAGYVLTNWNTSANGSGSKYLVGAQVTIAGSTLLYAQWSGHKLSTLFGAIGTFKTNSSSLSAALKSQIDRVAHTIKTRQYRSVTLFGYTAATGLKSLNVAVSRSRAANVANYLRRQLNALRDRGVSISSAGEGAIAGQTSNAYSRVEVFGV
ncbi:MAG TPA: InlB B-repeat-containing protein, partial [Acidimicrobiales bacterium]|nr:InlB B-repeat-containing protein [Acidimicrobiales bacterium]